MTLLVTVIFLSLSSFIPAWLTHDETIQAMLTDLFPLIALGNVTMNMGMSCWALVGAQGRYNLATTIATISSLLITIPLGVIFSVWLRIDLQGLAFAVVTGDTVTATALLTFLLISNWEKIARKVQDRVVVVAEEDDSDSDSSSSSASSSSSDSVSSCGSSAFGSGGISEKSGTTAKIS